MSLNKKFLLPVISTLVIIIVGVGLLLGYRALIKSQVEEGSKEITVNVVVNNIEGKQNYSKTYTFRTDAEFLGQLLDEENLIVAEDSTYGRYITGVDNISADSANSQYWAIVVNGQDSMVGMDQLAIKDKDIITLEFRIFTF